MISFITRCSSSLMFSRHRPGVAALSGFVGPFARARISLEGERGDGRFEFLIAAIDTEPVNERPQRSDRVRAKILVSDGDPELGRVRVVCPLHGQGPIHPQPRVPAHEAQPLRLPLDASRPVWSREPAAIRSRVQHRVDHVASVAKLEDHPRAQQDRHHDVGPVGAVRLLDHDEGVVKRVLSGRQIRLCVQPDEDQAPDLGSPAARKGVGEEVVGIVAAPGLEQEARGARLREADRGWG